MDSAQPMTTETAETKDPTQPRTTPNVRLLRETGAVSAQTDVLVAITPPASAQSPKPTSGAYCIVIDVSGSMGAEAAVTNDDGDKVTHGFSLLDIAKHATNTFVESLGGDDAISIVAYSSESKVVLGWTRCDTAGKAKSRDAVKALRTMGATNLTAGVESAFKLFRERFSSPVVATGLHSIVMTDGQPSQNYHPPGAVPKLAYGELVRRLEDGMVERVGETGRVITTTVGLGNSIDSDLLTQMSANFLHMPDPGCVGPFMVNLLAQLRSTAVVPVASRDVAAPPPPLVKALQENPIVGAIQTAIHKVITDPLETVLPSMSDGVTPVAATHAVLVVPADGVDGLPGYEGLLKETTLPSGERVYRVPLGTLAYDQPRHLIVRTTLADLTVSVELGGVEVCRSYGVEEAEAADGQLLTINALRLQCVKAIHAAAEGGSTANDELAAAIRSIEESSFSAHPSLVALRTTMRDEVVPGSRPPSFGKWGRHYLRTFSRMLRAQRRSNFRDAALQDFGKDAAGREGIFETLSNQAEATFAALTPPEPSLIRNTVQRARVMSAPLPDEFMRGGGCFAPEGVVTLLVDDEQVPTSIERIRPGDMVQTVGGGFERVHCVVRTECEGGRGTFTRLSNGLELTEWHPLIDGMTGRWRFPIMLGQRVVRPCAFVYNLVLEKTHVVLISGTGCVTLGHGIDEEVVRHPYWGSDEVLLDLQRRPGWAEGYVTLACEHKLKAA